MSENLFNAGAVVHGEVETDNRPVAPANYRDTWDLEMVEDGDYVGEVVVVKFCEVFIGTLTFAPGAENNELRNSL